MTSDQLLRWADYQQVYLPVPPDALDKIKALAARIRELQAQLPEGMEHCTIEFKECEHGHGRLVATNWVDHGCHVCRIRELEAENARLNAAYKILMIGLCGNLDSHDAGDLATLCKEGDAVRWSEFSPAARKLVEPILAKLHAAKPDASD